MGAGGTAPSHARCSIHQHQPGGWFGGLHRGLKLPVLDVGFLELGGDCGDGFQETEEEGALNHVIHVFWQGAARLHSDDTEQPRLRSERVFGRILINRRISDLIRD